MWDLGTWEARMWGCSDTGTLECRDVGMQGRGDSQHRDIGHLETQGHGM